jgi:hypothetical protein
MKYRAILLSTMFVLLYGCDNDAPIKEETMSVEWYKQHKPERERKLAECKNNPGELAVTPNCINAKKAANKMTWKARGNPKLRPLTADEINKRK